MKTGIACVALVAGASAQGVYMGNPYAARVAAPYWQTGARVMSPVAVASPYVSRPVYVAPQPQPQPEVEVDQSALLQEIKDGVAGVYDSVAAAKKAQLVEQRERYDYMGARGPAYNDAADNDEGRYQQYENMYEFQVTDTEAQKAYEAFVKNPNRKTSIKADYLDNFAKSDQYQLLFPGSSDKKFGPAGRYENMGFTGKLEATEDALKHAERNMAFNDDASAYYKALESYNDAESKAWEHTFRLSGDAYAANQIEASRKINGYLNTYDTYAASPNQRTTEDLHVGELNFASWWMDDVMNKQPVSKYLGYQAASANAKVQAARAQAAAADFTSNYGQYFG
jgi:hypothetical protein